MIEVPEGFCILRVDEAAASMGGKRVDVYFTKRESTDLDFFERYSDESEVFTDLRGTGAYRFTRFVMDNAVVNTTIQEIRDMKWRSETARNSEEEDRRKFRRFVGVLDIMWH